MQPAAKESYLEEVEDFVSSSLCKDWRQVLRLGTKLERLENKVDKGTYLPIFIFLLLGMYFYLLLFLYVNRFSLICLKVPRLILRRPMCL